VSEATETQSSEAHGEAGRRRLIGRVASDKMQKTVVVEVVRFKRDPVYKKYVRVRKRYKAHDEKNEFKTGDRVEIEEHRPLSREKRWKVVKLIERPAQELTGAVETP
jgi:small subunit ribosomal protein S17